MAEYNFREVEQKWQQKWAESKIYRTDVDPSKPKYYALDMFPYPSGAGLHVGHPLGYIASDIVARYKRLKGFNVLHPMGFDAFGLPAEQYAIQTGQHPAITTEENIQRYKAQLKNLGFSFDWEREVQTSDPKFYKWTQWIFMQLFDSWYEYSTQKAKPIEELVAKFEKEGNRQVEAACNEDTPVFTAAQWKQYSDTEKQKTLLKYRLTYPSEAMVNWCPELGTVLANDEVKDGVSERGGYPVERTMMKQWMMRITAYADRLLDNLQKLDWSEAMKEMQTNWIGKSHGCELDFKVQDQELLLTAFTTRPDTIYGVTFIVIAPEHEWIETLTTSEQKKDVEDYVEQAKNRSERERMADVKTVSGVFTGSHAINPFNRQPVEIWVADYVLAGYGTGVVMAVPSSDERDFRFAKHFDLPVIRVIAGTEKLDDPTEVKHGKMINSGILNDLDSRHAIKKAIEHAESEGFGKAKVNYKIRDAVFSRQRYWGEPVPVYFSNDLPHLINEKDLPLELPKVDEYKPTATGEPPLGRAGNWLYQGKYPYELTTMPGWAGSSWYFLRYMDAQNEDEFVSKEAARYWNEVDLYIGGTEHATGHLLYSRFWNLFLYDRGFIFHEEPFKKLINQGMIQGRSSLIYRVNGKNTYVSKGLIEAHEVTPIHVDVGFVENDILDVENFKQSRSDLLGAEFLLENGQFICDYEIDKMSKRYGNVVNPDDIVEKYGADTLRLYEMFLGPLEQSKPWNTHGIDGSFRFIRKFWKLFHDDQGNWIVEDQPPSREEWKTIHKTIKKVSEDIERYSFNTAVSEFMICVNDLTTLQCHQQAVLERLVVIVSPYAPHICEELWHRLGKSGSITQTSYPDYDSSYLQENEFEYPISINGKMRTKMMIALDMPHADIEKIVLASETVQKWTEGKTPRKVIIVPKRIVNIVV